MWLRAKICPQTSPEPKRHHNSPNSNNACVGADASSAPAKQYHAGQSNRQFDISPGVSPFPSVVNRSS